MRRSETITFPDHTKARREARFDIDLTTLPQGEEYRYAGFALVPLTFIERPTPTAFFVTDASGAVLPVLTKREERQLTKQGVIALARWKHPTISDSDIDKILRFLEERPKPGGRLMSLPADLEIGSAMSEEIRNLIEFGANYYIVAVLLPESPERQVVTMEWMVDLDGLQQPGRGALRRMGTIDLGISVDASGQCGSFHLRVVSPYDMMCSAEVQLREAKQGLAYRPRSVPGTPPMSTEVSVHYSSPSTVRWGMARIHLRHVPTGLVRTSALSAFLTFTLLVIGFVSVWAISGDVEDFRVGIDPSASMAGIDPSTSAALLLLVPTVLGAVVAAPATHQLTARVLVATRILLIGVSLTPILPLATIVFRLEGKAAWVMWLIACSGALLGLLAFVGQWVRLRTPPSTRPFGFGTWDVQEGNRR